MKNITVVRKIMKAVFLVIFLLLVGFFFMNYSVCSYQKNRPKKHIPILEKLQSNSQEQIQKELGEPLVVGDSVEALKLYFDNYQADETATKCIKYPKTMIYLKGDVVYFIHLNEESKMVDFSVVLN